MDLTHGVGGCADLKMEECVEKSARNQNLQWGPVSEFGTQNSLAPNMSFEYLFFDKKFSQTSDPFSYFFFDLVFLFI